jgi:1,4-dihydroxy-2-naphthoyl-CoA synthase
MVNKVVPAGSELDAALEYADILAHSAPLVLTTLKRFASDTLNRSPAEAAAVARQQLLTVRDSADGAEGRDAFAAKRTPDFRGR